MMDEPTHVFEAYTGVSRLLRHERWILAGSVINAYLFGHLWANSTANRDAGAFVRQQNLEDSEWLRRLIEREMQRKGWWIIPRAILMRRLHLIPRRPALRFLRRLLLVGLVFPIDLMLCLQVNRDVRRGGGLSYWGKEPKTAG